MLHSLVDTRALLAAMVMRSGGSVTITQAELDAVSGYHMDERGDANVVVNIKLNRGTSN